MGQGRGILVGRRKPRTTSIPARCLASHPPERPPAHQEAGLLVPPYLSPVRIESLSFTSPTGPLSA